MCAARVRLLFSLCSLIFVLFLNWLSCLFCLRKSNFNWLFSHICNGQWTRFRRWLKHVWDPGPAVGKHKILTCTYSQFRRHPYTVTPKTLMKLYALGLGVARLVFLFLTWTILCLASAPSPSTCTVPPDIHWCNYNWRWRRWYRGVELGRMNVLLWFLVFYHVLQVVWSIPYLFSSLLLIF